MDERLAEFMKKYGAERAVQKAAKTSGAAPKTVFAGQSTKWLTEQLAIFQQMLETNRTFNGSRELEPGERKRIAQECAGIRVVLANRERGE